MTLNIDLKKGSNQMGSEHQFPRCIFIRKTRQSQQSGLNKNKGNHMRTENFRCREEVVRRTDQTAMSVSRTDGDHSVFCQPRTAPLYLRPTNKPPFNMWTHLKHQSEKEHHSNAGNNICMVLDDKLMAQHRRVLVRLFSDPHVDAVRKTVAFAQRGCEVFSSSGVFFCGEPLKDLSASCTGPGSYEWRVTLLLVGGCRERETLRLNNDALYAQERKQLGLSVAS